MVYVVRPTGNCWLGWYLRDMKKVLAIPGSIRAGSSNHRLLQTIARLTAGELDVVIFEGVGSLPHFDPGVAFVPEPVGVFLGLLRDAHGVIICTPEYAHGVPGSLKNAIDWTVSSSGFNGKPTVLITASTDGRFAHAALQETLRVIEAREVDRLSLLIPFIRSKIDPATGDPEEKTLAEVKVLMEVFIEILAETRPTGE
jgi:chromate reductase